LFAPGKGSETRQKLYDESKKFSDDVKDAISKGKEKLSSLKEDIEQSIREQKEKFV
jgi:gas vesicle protein